MHIAARTGSDWLVPFPAGAELWSYSLAEHVKGRNLVVEYCACAAVFQHLWERLKCEILT